MKISIITVCYNAESTIRDCIESLLSQDYDDIEYIIVDGGSSDGTLKIVQEYHQVVSTFISEADQGMYDALNKGIKLATGQFIGVLHADDVFASDNVLSQVAEAAIRSASDIVYGDIRYVQKNDTSKTIRYWKSRAYHDKLFYRGWMPAHTGFFIKKQCFQDFGFYRLDLGTAADYELMLRMMLKYHCSSCYIPLVITCMRVGGQSNQSLLSRWRANRNDHRAWTVNGLNPHIFTLLWKPLSKIFQFIYK